MSDLSTELESTKESYTFPFKDISLDAVELNPFYILPRQNWCRKLIFSLSALNLKISFPLANK